MKFDFDLFNCDNAIVVEEAKKNRAKVTIGQLIVLMLFDHDEQLQNSLTRDNYINPDKGIYDEKFEEQAMDAMIELGLPEDEAERMLEDFIN